MKGKAKKKTNPKIKSKTGWYFIEVTYKSLYKNRMVLLLCYASQNS